MGQAGDACVPAGYSTVGTGYSRCCGGLTLDGLVGLLLIAGGFTVDVLVGLLLMFWCFFPLYT